MAISNGREALSVRSDGTSPRAEHGRTLEGGVDKAQPPYA